MLLVSVSIRGPAQPIVAEAYLPPDPGPYPEDKPKTNTVRFTPVQVPPRGFKMCIIMCIIVVNINCAVYPEDKQKTNAVRFTPVQVPPRV